MSSEEGVNSLIDYIQNFHKANVLVIGDIIADHYIWGRVERISPEAPVPIVDVQKESYMLGGAGNVANNILSLDGRVKICGVVGNDEMGRWINHELRQQSVNTDGIVVEDARPTTRKTRVVAHSQHVVRFDHENKGDISSQAQDIIIEYIGNHLKDIRVLVISDYAKGVVTRHLTKRVLELSIENNIPVVVDPKMKHFDYYTGATVITPNTNEASAASGIHIQNDESLCRAGEILLKQSGAAAILITRGEHGMSLFEKGGIATHIPSVARDVYDVTGAGDTVVSTLALSLAAGATLKEASRLANYAAGIVVGIVGTATVSRKQLTSVIC
jgi:D-beta-D-heptose 7-phosphate kinase/D-beta-D-heptose 1-phosphate adenosyltransferase